MLLDSEAVEGFVGSAKVLAAAWLAACLADDLVILEDMSDPFRLLLWHVWPEMIRVEDEY